MAVGDFNADGKLDLGVTSNAFYPGSWGYYGYYPGFYVGSANVLLGTGAGSFSAPTTTSLGYGYHTSATVADFNGDGKLDFATAKADSNLVSVLLATATGVLGTPTNFSTGLYPGSVAAGDVNGDGKVDLVTANASAGTVSVLLGNGLGSFGAAQTYAAGSQPKLPGDGRFQRRRQDRPRDGERRFRHRQRAARHRHRLFPTARDRRRGRLGRACRRRLQRRRPSGRGDGQLRLQQRLGAAQRRDLARAGCPSITVNDVTVTEGNTGTSTATFTVSLSAAYSQTVSVHYATADGSATLAGSDYQAASGTLTFAPGVTSQTITVLVNGDRLGESNESFSVRLTNPTNAFIADATGVGTIVDDEPYVSIDAARSAARRGTPARRPSPSP